MNYAPFVDLQYMFTLICVYSTTVLDMYLHTCIYGEIEHVYTWL